MKHLEERELRELKKKLEEERVLLSRELSRIGRRNPTHPADWEPQPEEMDIQEADRNEAADRIEAYEENTAILKELEARFNNIEEALKRMDEGTYSVCDIGNEPIKIERLYANPAAKTCVKHMSEDE